MSRARRRRQGEAAFRFVGRQRHADDAGRCDEHVRGLARQVIGNARGDGFNGFAPPLSGKRIGIARIDNQRAGVAEGERGAAPFDFGRRAFAVRCDASDRSAGRELDKGQVAAAPVLVARAGDARSDAGDGGESWEGGGEGAGGGQRFMPLRSQICAIHDGFWRSIFVVVNRRIDHIAIPSISKLNRRQSSIF